MPGFLNSNQRLNRDITICFLNTVKPHLYLDGFAATGIRAIRAEKEAGIRSVASERSLRAFDILKTNAELNDFKGELHWSTFESMVSKYHFDFIDVDPYGNIVPFTDIAINHIKNGGYIGFTATDLSVLTGSLKANTKRRYGSEVMNNNLRHEMGIRNLLGFIGRRAVSLETGMHPLISFYHGHFYRVIVQVRKSSAEADKTDKFLGYADPCIIDPMYGNNSYGPLWTGKLESFLGEKIMNIPETCSMDSVEFLGRLKNEDISQFFLDLTDSCSIRKANLPSVAHVLEKCSEIGISAARTHFSSTGIKCDNMVQLRSSIFTECS